MLSRYRYLYPLLVSCCRPLSHDGGACPSTMYLYYCYYLYSILYLSNNLHRCTWCYCSQILSIPSTR